MAKTKTKLCKKCSTTKPVEQFGPNKRSKDGYQTWCSRCRGINANQKTKKADKDSVIYSITNPIGEVYIGQTNMTPKYRWMIHKSAFKTKYGQYPLLHKSFEQWGFYGHVFSIVQNLGDLPKEELREIESNLISAYKLNNKSLNIRD
jgi:hypothetical protein